MLEYINKFAGNKGLMLLLCSIALAIVCVGICFSVIRGKISARQVFTAICRSVLFVAASALFGFLVSLIPVKGVWGRVVFYAALALVLIAKLMVYLSGERRAIRLATANSLRTSASSTAAVRNAKGWLYGTSIAVVFAAVLALILKQPYYLIMIPVAIVAVVILLNGILRWRIWYALGAIAIIAYAVIALKDAFMAADSASLVSMTAAVASATLLTSSFGTLTARK